MITAIGKIFVGALAVQALITYAIIQWHPEAQLYQSDQSDHGEQTDANYKATAIRTHTFPLSPCNESATPNDSVPDSTPVLSNKAMVVFSIKP
jgi:hypothetical protein